MTGTVKRWHMPRGTSISEHEDGEFVLSTDFARLEQEYAELAERYGKLQTGEGHITHRVIAERDAALKQVDELHGALEKISAIKNRYNCGDWDEIEEARQLSAAALSAKP